MATRQCDNCGNEVDPTHQFCRQCGLQSNVSPSGIRTNIPLHCKRCGAGLLARAKYCAACGLAIRRDPPDRFPVIVGVGGCIVVLVVAAVLLLVAFVAIALGCVAGVCMVF